VTTSIRAEPQWFVHGYRAALDRFDATRESRDAEERFIPLFEALNWAAAVLHPKAPHRLIQSGRSPTDDDTVLGLRLVRDRAHHQWAEAIVARDVPNPVVVTTVRGQSRIVMPPTHVEWFWRSLKQLPAAQPPFENPEGENAYSVQLADEPVRQALGRLDELLPR
jgi:hypothetical protein